MEHTPVRTEEAGALRTWRFGNDFGVSGTADPRGVRLVVIRFSGASDYDYLVAYPEGLGGEFNGLNAVSLSGWDSSALPGVLAAVAALPPTADPYAGFDAGAVLAMLEGEG